MARVNGLGQWLELMELAMVWAIFNETVNDLIAIILSLFVSS